MQLDTLRDGGDEGIF